MTSTAAADARVAMTAPASAHRADIEGLRGVAVLSVFAVHSMPHALGGGFIGVDIFFVLSGYLIAEITLNELARGRFSVMDFYVRRVRRLAPALLLVLLACLAFAVFWAFPSDAKSIGHHVVAGATFMSNLLLWTEGGYFDRTAERKLLLHLWSLGIEEQFYLLWPLVALLLARQRQRALWWVGAALLASFTLNIVLVGVKPKATFFLPPTRFWELLMGVMLAYANHHESGGPMAICQRLTPRSWRMHKRLPDLFSIGGLSMLASALWLIDKDNQFPGWWALLPTTGTVLLVAAGGKAWVNRVVLQNPMLTFYGHISYPLYLWHWPLLTMPLLLDEPFSIAQRTVLLAVCVAVAAATVYGVERPLRYGPWAKRAPWFLGAGLAMVAGMGWTVYRSDGLLARYPESVRAIAAADVRGDYHSYRVDRCFLRSEQKPDAFAPACVDQTPPAAPLLLLWGDSHAAALYPGLRAAADAAPGSMRLAQFTAAACPPGWHHAVPDNPNCAALNADVAQRIARLRPATVVLAANWAGPALTPTGIAEWSPFEALRDVVAALRTAGVPRVIVVGPLPHWPVAPPRVLLKSWADNGSIPGRGADALNAETLTLDRALQAASLSAGAQYASPIHALCEPVGCILSLREGTAQHAVAFDESHLTAAASRHLVRSMPQLFAP